MNRNTDVSRLRPTLVQEPPETGTRPSGCAAAVERATTLLVHSMQAADTPISQLSEALARMAQTLGNIGAPLFGQADAESTADVRMVRDAFKHDIAVCIESLQFHDRMMQQLTQARDILSALAANKLLARVPNVPANDAGPEGSIELF